MVDNMPINSLSLYGAHNWRGRHVGLLGGSFNPAHKGHKHISVTALKRLQLDSVWWLVSPQNPLKPARDMAPLPARLRTAAAVENHPRIIATDIETALGTRYTVDTVRKLIRRFPQTRFVWLMGADNLASFHRWKDWRQLARLLPIAVLLRPGYTNARLSAPSLARLPGARRREGQAARWPTWTTPAIVVISLPMESSSATAIRAKNPGWHLSN
jgi:nicotinate-nucleotide adenylyltransferase